MKKWLYALAFLFAFAMIALGFSMMQMQQSNMPAFHNDNFTGSATALNVTNFQSSPVDLELIAHVKFLIIRTDSSIFPTGKIYVNGQFAINVTEPTLHILELSVIANRFYRFQIIFNNGTYSPFFSKCHDKWENLCSGSSPVTTECNKQLSNPWDGTERPESRNYPILFNLHGSACNCSKKVSGTKLMVL